MDKPSHTIKYHWHAGINSGGNLSLMLTYPDAKTKWTKEEALAEGIAKSVKAMHDKGFLKPEARFMTSSDLSKEYGFTRQYWEKLLKEGKILYKEASAGMITTDIWVEGYLGDREKVDRYVRNCKSAVAEINEVKGKHGVSKCYHCGEDRLEFNKNTNNISALCRACGFYVHTTN